MTIRDVMTRDVVMIEPEASLTEAARRMRGLDVGPLPVVDGGLLVGMVTDRDIAIRGAAEARDPSATSVAEVMTRDVVCCFEDDDVQQAARTMQRHQLRRLVVVDVSGRVAGIVSLGDLAVRSNERLAGETLEKISEPPTTY
jgi:CBS domain-containing protein